MGAASQMPGICRDLMGRAEYDGPDFSHGDRAISEVASGTLGTGNPTQWLQWCVNHHIEFTVQEIRNQPEL